MHEEEPQFSLKSFFVPFTTSKAIHFIILIGFLVFGNMLFNDFAWDDLSYIVFNPDVHSLNLVHLFQANGFNTASQYRALAAVYFAVLYSIFSNTSFFYHFIQLLLHISNGILVLFLFKKFFNLKLSFFLALIFLIHPIQVESVSFIGASGNVLFFLLGIITVLLFYKEKNPKISTILLAYFLLLVSILIKETGITFVLLTVFITFLLHRKNKILNIVSSAIVIGIYFLIRIGVSGVTFDPHILNIIVPITDLSLPARLSNVPAIFFYYLKTFVYPSSLAINQIWIISAIDFQQFYLPLFIDCIFLLLCIFSGYIIFKKYKNLWRPYLLFSFWFLIGMGMHMQIIPLDMTVADRWFYFTIVGLLGIIGIWIHIFQTTKPNIYKKISLIIAICIVTIFSVRSIVRNTNWANDIALLTHDTAEIDNFQNENNLATFYSLKNQPKEALRHVRKSVGIFAYDANLTNMGFIYENLGDYKNAEVAYSQVLNTKNITPVHAAKEAFAYLHLGGLYLSNENPAAAENIYKRALLKYPTNGVLWAFLAASQYKLHKQNDALASAQNARKYYPNNSTNNLYEKIKDKKDFDVRKL